MFFGMSKYYICRIHNMKSGVILKYRLKEFSDIIRNNVKIIKKMVS